MKKTAISIIIILSLGLQGRINAQENNEEYYNRLYYLCQSWGHLKYYHSEIANGNIKWDDKVVEFIREIKSLDSLSFIAAVEDFIEYPGQSYPSHNQSIEVVDSLKNIINLSWIESPYFTPEARQILLSVYHSFKPQESVFVEANQLGVPRFNNDSLYYHTPNYPSEEYRVLAVFRFWNIIKYFYPYLDVIDQDWDDVLIEILPSVVESRNSAQYHLAVKKLQTKINDTHAENFGSSVYYDLDGMREHTPFLARYVEGETIITKTLPSAGEISVGDIVLEIEGIDIYQYRDSLREYACGSNEAAIERNITHSLLYGAPGPVLVKTSNGEREKSCVLYRTYYTIDSLLARTTLTLRDTVLSDDIQVGIVNMNFFTEDMLYNMMARFYDYNSIVFDLRGYPNNTLASLLRFLVDTEDVHIANVKKPLVNSPGDFCWEETHYNLFYLHKRRFNGRIILLFNEDTQSQAEYTCMGLELCNNVVKIGSTTAGADGNVAYTYLPGGIVTMFSSMGVFYPDFTPTQRIGIIPDYFVSPTIGGIRDGKDEVLEFALNLISNDSRTYVDRNSISVYPIPANTYIQINLDNIQYHDIKNFSLYGIDGKKWISRDHNSFSERINIAHLPSGLYFITLFTNDEVILFKRE